MISYNAQSAREKALRGVMELADECVDLCAQLRQLADENASMQALLERGRGEADDHETFGCEFCTPTTMTNDIITPRHILESRDGKRFLYVDWPNARLILADQSDEGFVEGAIHYCPMCGRPL